SNIAEAFKLDFDPYNLASGKPVTASSATETGAAALAVDGGAGSRWESNASDSEWLAVDLQANQTIEQVVIKWENAYAEAYEIQVSDDADTWTTVYTTTDGTGGTDVIPFEPV